MSKSLGNFLMIKDIVKTYHPEVIRLFLLSHHYRSPVDFTDQAIRNTAAGLDKIYALLERVEKFLGGLPELTAGTGLTAPALEKDFLALFHDAMNDDFNTAQGIGVLFDAVRHLNRLLDMEEKSEADPDSSNRVRIAAACGQIIKMGDILGLFSLSPAAYFDYKKSRAINADAVDPAEIDAMVAERQAARKAKDFQRADAIRDRLKKMNIEIEDRPDGTIWRVVS